MAHDFYILGCYRYIAKPGRTSYSVRIDHEATAELSGTEDKVKSYDQILHQSLVKIFSEHCLNDSEQIKEFLRVPQHNTDYNFVIKPILEQEPFLSEHFSKEELGKLSLLWIAVLGCYLKSAELLVRSGANVNELFGRRDPQVIDENWTVLYVLLQMEPFPENERLVRLVIDHVADLEARDHQGQTVLHYAVLRYRVQMIKLLLEKGVDVNVGDNVGITPLLAAAMRDKPIKKVVPLLMKYGADIFPKNTQAGGVWVYLIHCPMKRIKLFRILIENSVSIKENRNYQYKLIRQAATNGKNEMVKLYLDYGIDVNAQDVTGGFPLYYAAGHGRNTVVETLLKRGANVHLRTSKGRTALHAACENALWRVNLVTLGSMPKEMFKLLLSAGADILVEDCDGTTPLAVILSNEEIMEPPGIWVLIEELALRKARQPSIELKDERIIEQHPKLRDYYRENTEEIDKMKLTRFIETCNLFELLTKNDCQNAALMRNPGFEAKFKQCDMRGYSIHANDIVRAFERAQKHYHALLEQENVINEAVYDVLPYVVVKEVVRYIFDGCCSKNVK